MLLRVPDDVPVMFSSLTSPSDRVAVRISTGLTLDPCSTSEPCQEGRECVSYVKGSEGESCQVAGGCTCMPPDFKDCNASSDCESGELCARVFRQPKPFCVSEFIEETEDYLEEVSDAPGPSQEIGESSGGLSMDFCSTQEDCSGEGECLYFGVTTDFTFCEGREPCICLDANISCFVPSDCNEGEICAETPISLFASCISKEASENAPGVTEIVLDEPSNGLTLDSCRQPEDCEGLRSCVYFNLPQFEPCSDKGPCVCLPTGEPRCAETSDCGEGEVCAEIKLSPDPICVSKTAADTFSGIQEISPQPPLSSPSVETDSGDPAPETSGEVGSSVPSSEVPEPSPSMESGGCIDSLALQHLSRDELVFADHVWSRVLCDKNESCATEGHMVIHEGKAMMMMTYCQTAKCVERMTYVNSPRFKKSLRVHSNTEGLTFMTFAARYSTKTEEVVISLAVWFGL